MIATCLSCLTTGGPDKEHGADTGKSQEGAKEGGLDQLPIVLFSGIHLRCLCHQEGDWPETTQKLTPLP